MTSSYGDTNKIGRVFYACQKVQIRGPSGVLNPRNIDWDKIQGLQSISVDTNFNLQPIFQFGQLGLYENLETVPDIEISLTKVFDGYPLIYQMAVGEGNLVEVANHRCGIRLGIFKEVSSVVWGQKGLNFFSDSMLTIEPAYLSQVTYNLTTDDKFTETVTLVANHRRWDFRPEDFLSGGPMRAPYPGTDYPGDRSSPLTNGRDKVRLGGSSLLDRSTSIFPFMELDGAMNVTKGGGIMPGAHIKGMTITVNLPREPIKDIGFFFPKMRPIGFPADITCEIITTAISGDNIGIDERTGANRDKNIHDTWTSQQDKSINVQGARHGLHKSLDFHTIKIVLCDGTTFDLGSRNKLSSVAYNGDTSAANTLITYSFTTSNNFTFSRETFDQSIIGYSSTSPGNQLVTATEWFEELPLKFLE